MILLAVETTSATGSLSIGRWDASKLTILSSRRWQKKSTHSEVVTLELQAALGEAKIELASVTHLAVDHGPGSFTGIRVGLNLIRTLAYARDLPVATVNSLEVLAHQNLKSGESAIVAIPAVQEFFYACAFRRGESGLELLKPCESLTRDGLQNWKSELQPGNLLIAQDEPKAESILEMVLPFANKRSFLTWKDVQPLYIRASEAEEKMRKGLLKPLT